MRILHTADWHLGDRLGRVDRTHDLRRAVERVGSLCQRHHVDVLLVAGDLFSEMARPDNLRETIEHWQTVFQDFLTTGGTIITLTGNHDNENFCRTLSNAMNLASPAVGHMGEIVPPGRLYLATEPSLLKLADPHNGNNVQFLLMPYPTPSRYLRGDQTIVFDGMDDKNSQLNTAFLAALHRIQQHDQFDRSVPTVLAAHINVSGATAGPGLFRMAAADDVVFRAEDLPMEFAYVALGHIHQAQTIGGREHVRYSGSIDKLDFGEANDHKSVTLFELDSTGLVGLPETLPLLATPIVEIRLEDPTNEIEVLKERYPEPCMDLVKFIIKYTAGKDQLETILEQLHKMFPRWYARDIRETGELTDRLSDDDERPHGLSFQEEVREYVKKELTNHTDDERDEVLRRLEKLFESS